MVLLLESWTDLLPPFLVHNMEEQLILPKLQREVRCRSMAWRHWYSVSE